MPRGVGGIRRTAVLGVRPENFGTTRCLASSATIHARLNMLPSPSRTMYAESPERP